MQCKLTFRSAGETHIGPQDIDLLELGSLITASAKFLRSNKRQGTLTLDRLENECIVVSTVVTGKAADEIQVLYDDVQRPQDQQRPDTRKRVAALNRVAAKSKLEVALAPEGKPPASLSGKSILNSSYLTSMNFNAIYCGNKLKEDGSIVLHMKIEGENFEAPLRVDDDTERHLMLQKLPNDVRIRVHCEGSILRDWRSLKVLQYSVTSIVPAVDSREALINLINAMQPWAAAEFIDESMAEEWNDKVSV
jgi:hypothetical protein